MESQDNQTGHGFRSVSVTSNVKRVFQHLKYEVRQRIPHAWLTSNDNIFDSILARTGSCGYSLKNATRLVHLEVKGTGSDVKNNLHVWSKI